MKILAIKTSGDHTSVSVILNDEINSFSMTHDRKERPDWNFFLANIGHKRTFTKAYLSQNKCIKKAIINPALRNIKNKINDHLNKP